MNEHVTSLVNFESYEKYSEPYRYFIGAEFLNKDSADALLEWFVNQAIWDRRSIDDFYETFDVNFSRSPTEGIMAILGSETFRLFLKKKMEALFDCRLSPRVDMSAHKLVPGYRIGVHTDHGEQPHTHRLLIQVNSGWSPSNGGLLFVLNTPKPTSIEEDASVYIPAHQSSFAFEITPNSYHAVSKVLNGVRYTLVYSFLPA
jgi:hypothetical protein